MVLSHLSPNTILDKFNYNSYSKLPFLIAPLEGDGDTS